MLVNLGTIKKYIALVAAFMAGILVISISSRMSVHIAVMVVYSFFAAALVAFDVVHPYCWFSLSFCLYSVAHPILDLLGYRQVPYSSELMSIQLMALFVFQLVITPTKICRKDAADDKKTYVQELGAINKMIYIMLSVIIILAVFFVSRGGYVDKGEIYASGNPILTFAFRCPLILTLLYCLSASMDIENTGVFPKRKTVLTAGVLLAITLFSGERDFIFRFVVMLTLLLWYYGYIRLKHLLLIAPAAILAMPLTTVYKYYFLSGQKRINSNPLIYDLLSGEFESASRNLQMVLNDSGQMKGIMGIEHLGQEVLSVFISSLKSSQAWFNDFYFPGSRVQYGFSLVGDGYLMAGYIGVILVFVLTGLLVKFFYRKSVKSPFWLAAYFYFATVVIYAIRGDFSVILAAMVKQMGLVLLILYVFGRLSRRKRDRVHIV